MADNTLDAGLPRSPHDTRPIDYTRDPDFVSMKPADKHKVLSDMNSPGYDPHYAAAPPLLQQKYIQSLSPSKVGATETVPVQSQQGGIYQATKPEAALRDWSGPIAKILASSLAAQGSGALAGPVATGMGLGNRGRGFVESLARPAGAGTVSGAMTPGTVGDKLQSGLEGAGWGAGGELMTRAGNAVVTSPKVSKFGSRMVARPSDPGTPPSNPVTGSAILHDTGSQQPAGSPFAPKAIVNPGSGQAEGVVNTPAVESLLARHGIPPSGVPAKDLLITRTPSPGTPATPENVLSRLLRSGLPAGAMQEPNAQKGAMGLGIMLSNILSNLGDRWGFSTKDPNHTGPGAKP